MAFIPKPNSGVLWPNEKKQSPNQPDVRGDLFLAKDMLMSLMDKEPGDLVKIAISGWRKEIIFKDCISLAASEPYVKTQDQPPPKRTPDDVEDIPF